MLSIIGLVVVIMVGISLLGVAIKIGAKILHLALIVAAIVFVVGFISQHLK